MSAHETVPTPQETAQALAEDADGFLAWVQMSIEDIPSLERDRRRFHDQDAWFAREAGSEACRALGHVHPDHRDDLDPYSDAYLVELDGWDTEHPFGWDTRVCEATKYGRTCAACEGECDAIFARSVWSMPGVAAAG